MRMAPMAARGRPAKTTMPSGPIYITMFSRENKASWRGRKQRWKKNKKKKNVMY